MVEKTLSLLLWKEANVLDTRLGTHGWPLVGCGISATSFLISLLLRIVKRVITEHFPVDLKSYLDRPLKKSCLDRPLKSRT